jgi:hypothetical protein
MADNRHTAAHIRIPFVMAPSSPAGMTGGFPDACSGTWNENSAAPTKRPDALGIAESSAHLSIELTIRRIEHLWDHLPRVLIEED